MDPYANTELAGRLESLVADSQRCYAEAHARLFPEQDAAWIRVAGGVAAFLERDSPANGAFAVGMCGPVTQEEFDLLGRFFRDRGTRPIVCACPLADASLAWLLDEQGFSAASFDDVLVCELSADDDFDPPAAGVEIRRAETDDDRAAWAALVAAAFAAPDPPSPAEVRLGRSAAVNPDSQLFTAYVNGEPAGVGELFIGDGIGLLTADATMPAFRRLGVQSSLQRARLEAARDAGCTLAMSEAMPGSASQRNMERLGFRIVYTRVEALGPATANERT